MRASTRQVRVTHAVEAAMRSLEEAERALDAEGLIALFARARSFHVLMDGQRLAYGELTENIRSAFGSLRGIEGGFDDIQVFVLSADAALAAASFRNAVTGADGLTKRVRGAASWLWRLVDGQWRICYGQVQHIPEEG